MDVERQLSMANSCQLMGDDDTTNNNNNDNNKSNNNNNNVTGRA